MLCHARSFAAAFSLAVILERSEESREKTPCSRMTARGVNGNRGGAVKDLGRI